ncbi:nitrate/nitrite transporter NrtS [Perlabentimonas gracilis]|uniref:nitrate/nitrite transporter NrtS n=1 Tax=Perlabentimonas gracilis TaxID=2715279 RepID=UPI00140AD57A|nr:nitrate/nitrite transporter NrtS [Perlabentimonas gracilis]NHB70331.1 PAS domain S-box protein [Perlabentimonas gracilis]
MKLKSYFAEAIKPLVVRRAIRVALIVGIILNAINQGYSITHGFQNFHVLQFILTFIVPYLVSTYSVVLSKFNFVSGEVASVDALIQCKKCNGSTFKIHKGELVPYCPSCKEKTTWKMMNLLPPVSVVEDDKLKSNALFAEFNPAPVLRVNASGQIIKANPKARILFNIEGEGEHIQNVIPEISTLDFKSFISKNDSSAYQIKIQDDYYQLDLKAVVDLDVFHIYASKNTQLIEERNQRLLFQTAIEKTTDSVMVTDTQGGIVFVNSAFENHSGYSLQEIKGKNPRILKSGFQKDEVYKEMWETITKGEIWKGLFRNRKKNGELYWERATITPVSQPDGSISHYMALKEDVSEELKLKDDLNSFALFAKHNPSPVMRFGADGVIVEANPAATKLFELKTLIGLNAFELIRDIKAMNIDTLIKDDKKEILTAQIGESYFQLVIKGVNELQLCHVYGTDITVQKHAEKIIESMALFAKLNPEPVFRFNSEFKIVEANPAALETFPEMIKGNDVREVIPPFADIPVFDFINGNKQILREENINEKIYRFMIRGLRETQVCQVYSSDITLRVEQEQMIQEQAEKISSSIRYASNIQAAVLPNLNYVGEILPQNMMLYLPRDVVSGDFYWIKKVGESIVIAIADCTGHGVPGAFMSMLGVAFLNEIVKPEKVIANEILNELRNYVINTLSNSQDSRADGMDMALCIIEPTKKVIQYAGAYNPFVLINKLGITEIKADRMPIGRYVNQHKPFTLHEIPYTEGDVVYLFSDGYHDQIGGPNLQKYGSKNFKELLLSIHEKSFDEQKIILNKTLDDWTSAFHRIDDVIVMGFKLT